MASVDVRGTRYRIGGDPRHQPHPLPDWFPALPLSEGWEEIRHPFDDDSPQWRAFFRAYHRPRGVTTRLLVSCATETDGHAWLHLSVSRSNATLPTWEALCAIKERFIGPERTAIQVHPPQRKYVNMHPGVLHLWCCLDAEVLPDFTAGGDTI